MLLLLTRDWSLLTAVNSQMHVQCIVTASFLVTDWIDSELTKCVQIFHC